MAWVRVPWRRLLLAVTAGGAIGVPFLAIFILVGVALMDPEHDPVEVLGLMLAMSVGYCLLISASTLVISRLPLRAAARRWPWINNLGVQFAAGMVIGFLVSLALILVDPILMFLGPLFMAPLSGGVTMMVWAGVRAGEIPGPSHGA